MIVGPHGQSDGVEEVRIPRSYWYNPRRPDDVKYCAVFHDCERDPQGCNPVPCEAVTMPSV